MSRRINPKLLQEERRLANKVARKLRDMGNKVARLVEARETEKGLISDILFDVGLEFESIADDIVLHQGRVWDLSQRIQLRKLRNIAVIDETQLRTARDLFLANSRELVLSPINGTIYPTTVTRIRELVSEGLTTGESYTSIAKKIREQTQAGVFSPDRAKMIATNQLKKGYELGGAEPYEQLVRNGTIVRKRRLTVNDDRVTETHMANQEEGWIHYNANWQATGDFLPPGSDNPRCRCTVQYEVDGVS